MLQAFFFIVFTIAVTSIYSAVATYIFFIELYYFVHVYIV